MNGKLNVEAWYAFEPELHGNILWTFSMLVDGDSYDFSIPKLPEKRLSQGSDEQKSWKEAWLESWETFLEDSRPRFTEYHKGGRKTRAGYGLIAIRPAVEFFSGTHWSFEQVTAADVRFGTLEEGLDSEQILAWLFSLKKLKYAQNEERGILTETQMKFHASRSMVSGYPSKNFPLEKLLVEPEQNRCWML
jgi:hypothetical protein